MNLIESIKNRAKVQGGSVVLPEGDDPRMLHAARIIVKQGLAQVYILGNVADIKALAAKEGADLTGVHLIDPEKAENYLMEAIKRYQQHINNPADPGMPRFYMEKIGDAYFRVEELDRAEEAFKKLKERYGEGYADFKLKAIQEVRAKAAKRATTATSEIETTTVPEQGEQ